MSDPVKTFNESLRYIFDRFAALPSPRFKAGIAIRALREQMSRGISAQPEYSLVVLGPHLLTCRDDITTGEASRILAIDHRPHIIRICAEHKVNVVEADQCIAFMKDAYVQAPPDVRSSIASHCRVMLASYAQFRLSSPAR